MAYWHAFFWLRTTGTKFSKIQPTTQLVHEITIEMTFEKYWNAWCWSRSSDPAGKEFSKMSSLHTYEYVYFYM